MHLEIIKIVRIVNDIFGVQILLLMIISIISITILFYLLYRVTWLELTTDSYLQELVPLTCWIFFYIMLIFYINHVCAKTITEVWLKRGIVQNTRTHAIHELLKT